MTFGVGVKTPRSPPGANVICARRISSRRDLGNCLQYASGSGGSWKCNTLPVVPFAVAPRNDATSSANDLANGFGVERVPMGPGYPRLESRFFPD